jgi:mevalonate kinase
MSSYYSNGKLLITGEYLVLKGALALAIPCKKGQSLYYQKTNSKLLNWKSYDENKKKWFEGVFESESFKCISTSNNFISEKLVKILQEVRNINKHFLVKTGGEVTTKLDFPREWGLGSSSTLISNLAQWAKINPYEILEKTFGGSGYDIACAISKSTIIYNIKNSKQNVIPIVFNPPFIHKLFFVYLNKKQNSELEVNKFKNIFVDTKIIDKVNSITKMIVKTKKQEEFNHLLFEHEKLIASVLKKTRVKELMFPDFDGEIKSLGAWGGDFILVSSKKNPSNYFRSKGFTTIIKYESIRL